MAEKDLRRMKRSELIEIIYELKTREEQLLSEKEALEEKLNQREIQIAESGSIAEAALKLNKVFEAAQAAADDYLLSIKQNKDQNKKEKIYFAKEENKSPQKESLAAQEGEASINKEISFLAEENTSELDETSFNTQPDGGAQ